MRAAQERGLEAPTDHILRTCAPIDPIFFRSDLIENKINGFIFNHDQIVGASCQKALADSLQSCSLTWWATLPLGRRTNRFPLS